MWLIITNLSFGEHCFPLLFNAHVEKLRLECNLLQSVQNLGEHLVSSEIVDNWSMDMENGMMEVRVCIGPVIKDGFVH